MWQSLLFAKIKSFTMEINLHDILAIFFMYTLGYNIV